MKRFVIILFAAAFTAYISCHILLSSVPVSGVFYEKASEKTPLKEPQIKNVSAYNSVYKIKEEILLNFIQEHFIGKNGEVFTNIKPSGGDSKTLSESVGLLMNYGVLRDRKDLFDTMFSFLSRNLLSGGYIRWKSGSEQIKCNAAIDDLRIISALLDAYEIWGDKKYFDTAWVIQKRIYDKQVLGGNLYEFYDWGNGTRKNAITLCYLDLYTLERMSIFNKNWHEVGDRALTVINNGRISPSNPLFNKYFSYETNRYSMDEEFARGQGICLTYSIYTALHLARINQSTEYFTRWLEKEMEKGKLYAWYNPHTLTPAREMESTAVYALSAIYSRKVGEEELYKKLLDKMLQFMVTNVNSPYYGGFGNEESGEFYSFDNLTALWALALAED